MPARAGSLLRPAGIPLHGAARSATGRDRDPECWLGPPSRGRCGRSLRCWPGAGAVPGARSSVRGGPHDSGLRCGLRSAPRLAAAAVQ
eukprot:1860929-Lingulodinium_polyedra.AAC.1